MGLQQGQISVGGTVQSAADRQRATACPRQVDGGRLGQGVLNLVVNAQHAVLACPPPRTVTIDTGLGLPVSRSVARNHGGELLLEASPRGAGFLLTLPIRGAAAEVAPPVPPAAEAPVTSRRALVVDDEPEIADLMRAILEGAGHEVATAESGAVALQMLDEARFDPLVSDLRMPDTDGAALWREVGVRQPRLARSMLFVSGDTLSPGARQFLAEAGCQSLDKPFAKAELLARVDTLLRA